MTHNSGYGLFDSSTSVEVNHDIQRFAAFSLRRIAAYLLLGLMGAFAYTDVLEPAGDAPLRVIARISVLTPEEGGPTGPRRAKYRPNHNFGAPEGRIFYIGQVEIPEGNAINPGETHDLVVTFLNVRGIADLAQVGRRWRIQEGPNLVANAEVLEILPGPDTSSEYRRLR